MPTGTNAPLINCPKCNVKRVELQEGQWCPTCGYNPKYEQKIAGLRTVLKNIENAHPMHFDGAYERMAGHLQALAIQGLKDNP